MSELFPNDWDSKRLNELGESYSGLKSKTKADFIEEGNAKFVTYRNINKNYFVDENDLFPVVIEESENQNAVRKGDVLFTTSSETPEEVAFSSVMKNNIEELYLNSFSFGYRFNKDYKVEPEFYAYYFRGNYFRKVVFPLAQGSTRYNISRNELLKLHVPVPPIKEQQKIAAILSSVDEAIEKTEQIIEQTERVKKGLMQELLTKGIGHTEFKDSPIGKVPNEWVIKSFKDLSTIRQGLQIPISERFNEGGNDRYKYITIQYLNGAIDAQFIQSPRKNVICSKNDILMTRTGNTGQIITDVEGVFHNNFFLINYNKEMLDKNYLLNYLNSYRVQQLIKNLAGTTTIPDLNHGDFYSILIPVPQLEEQIKISKIIKKIEEKISHEQTVLKAILTIKQGLMQELLTGKKRVKVDDSEEVLS